MDNGLFTWFFKWFYMVFAMVFTMVFLVLRTSSGEVGPFWALLFGTFGGYSLFFLGFLSKLEVLL